MTDRVEHIPLANIAEESSGTISRAASHPTLLNAPLSSTPLDLDFQCKDKGGEYHPHTPGHHQHQEHPPTTSQAKRLSRSNSNVSHVSLEFFDPAGVQRLRRVLTSKEGEAGAQRPSSSHSSTTLNWDEDQPFDFEKTLRHVVRRREEGNIKHRRLGIVFRDLEVIGKSSANAYQPTVGTLLNPLCMLEGIQNARHPPLKTILMGFEGVVKPGEMLLVLGSPGSGCSTLLKMLANQRHEYHAVNGTIHYDSLTPDDVVKQFRGDVQYCPEDDVHFPTMTVEQTLDFAAAVRTPRARADVTRKEFKGKVTDILTTIFGLRHVRKTVVGDAAVRGVSGGQKKRVSIAESMAARSCIGAWDNSTRGLDASTALEFGRALRIATDTFQTTTIVSIYQAGESLFELFDKVCVIYEGKMAYFGPAAEAKQYFLDMGYQPANRQTTPDFLVTVTDPKGRIPSAGVVSQPRTADEFAAYFKSSKAGQRNRQEMKEYEREHVGKNEKKMEYVDSARAELAKHTSKSSPYLLSIGQQVAAVMARRVQIMRGNMLVTGINLFSFVFQAVVMGTVYLKSPEETGAFFSRGGVLFFAILFSGLTAMAEIPALFHQRPIVHRQQLNAFYHPFVEAAALTLVDVPISFVILAVFGVILYFVVGLQKSADQFFVFYLFIFCMTIVMKAWFRAVAACFRSEATAQAVGGFSILVLTIYTGFTIPKPSMIGALRWLTYINPLRYGFEAVVANEFRTLKGKCTTLVPQGAGYDEVSLAHKVCATVGSVPGEDFVDGNRFIALAYGFFWSKTWMNLGIVIAFGVAFIFALLILSEYNTATSQESSGTQFKRGSKKAVLPQDSEEEAAGHGGALALSTSRNGKAVERKPTLKHEDIFSWQHVNYTVPVEGGERKLLDDVSGFVAPGKLTALMGESGAGKTTLLNVLALRTSVGVVTGNMLVNGRPLPVDFQSQSGYCQQMDTHVPFSTVREALLFSAKLRQPSSVSVAEKEAWVEKCLVMCGLQAYAEAAIGSLSIEFKKRTTIGVELAAKPKLLLFLDEPTSGLDSQSAWSIVSFLRSLGDQGQAILCTIHQPSAELFQVFDRLLLLRKGGQTVYFGDLGPNATTLIHYFERNGGRECLDGENPAEYILDVIGAGATASSEQDWYETWCGSDEAKQVQGDLERIHAEGRARPAVEAAFHSEFATSWWYQFRELLFRDAQAHWRNPTYIMAKLSLNILGGLFIGFTFFKAKDSQQGTQNKLFAIFMATILSVPLSNQLQVPFVHMRTIYEIRERPSRMYSWTALVASQITTAVPWNILGSTLLFLCWFWTVGFPNDRAGYTYLMLGVLFPFYYTTFAQSVAAMAPSAEIAALLFSFLFSFVITFDGVVQPFSQLGWWRWMYRLSPYTYLIEGLLGQAIGNQEINCSAVEFVTLEPPPGLTCQGYMEAFTSVAGGYITNPEATSSCNFCAFRTTDQFLGLTFNIFFQHRWRDVRIVVAFIVFNIFLVFMMTYLFRIRTGSLLPSFKHKKN